jgi:hypothetical protein
MVNLFKNRKMGPQKSGGTRLVNAFYALKPKRSDTVHVLVLSLDKIEFDRKYICIICVFRPGSPIDTPCKENNAL